MTEPRRCKTCGEPEVRERTSVDGKVVEERYLEPTSKLCLKCLIEATKASRTAPASARADFDARAAAARNDA